VGSAESRGYYRPVTEFETTGYIALGTLHDATVRFVASAAGFDVVITDALFPLRTVVTGDEAQ
jgi:hypothetical protein